MQQLADKRNNAMTPRRRTKPQNDADDEDNDDDGAE